MLGTDAAEESYFGVAIVSRSERRACMFRALRDELRALVRAFSHEGGTATRIVQQRRILDKDQSALLRRVETKKRNDRLRVLRNGGSPTAEGTKMLTKEASRVGGHDRDTVVLQSPTRPTKSYKQKHIGTKFRVAIHASHV